MTLKAVSSTGGSGAASTRPVRINGLGDSITAKGQYQPTGANNAPVWQASTAYVVGNIVANNGIIYRCTTAGTSASSGGPTGLGSGISDGTVVWTQQRPSSSLTHDSYLGWAEKWSNGQLYVDQSQGIAGIVGGLVKVIVINGGSGYSPSDTVSIAGSGVSATLSVSGGVITAVNVTNPGQPSVPFSASITTSTGSGAVLSGVHTPSGTFGVTGCYTQDMVARLPDVVASSNDIIVVHGGTNDITNNISSDTVIANLKTCYETLVNAGKRVIAMPITPKTSATGVQVAAIHRVNKWIRDYCRLQANANPNNLRIDIADPTGYFTDGTSTTNAPVGGSGTSAYAMTVDGLHPSPRGAMYEGYCVWKAAQRLIGGGTPDYPARGYSQTDGYDPVRNPGGNLIEGTPWGAGTAYAVGAIVANDTSPVKAYVCTTAGTSAGSGGPTGTGSSISDNTCVWKYARAAGLSVTNGGIAGTATAAGGISYVGNIPTGTVFSRLSGSASGTITFISESPWSSGQAGQRFVIDFSLGSGAANEIWNYTIANANKDLWGIQNSDLLVAYVYGEVEVELSNVANLSWCGINMQDTGGAFLASDMVGSTVADGRLMMKSSGEMVPYPNGGKILLRTKPLLLPSGVTTLNLQLQLGFQCSGGAGSATTTVKVNYSAMRKAFVN